MLLWRLESGIDETFVVNAVLPGNATSFSRVLGVGNVVELN